METIIDEDINLLNDYYTMADEDENT